MGQQLNLSASFFFLYYCHKKKAGQESDCLGLLLI